jgi:hypothetical protein
VAHCPVTALRHSGLWRQGNSEEECNTEREAIAGNFVRFQLKNQVKNKLGAQYSDFYDMLIFLHDYNA